MTPEKTSPPKADAVDLSVTVGPLKLKNPLMVASGTFGGIQDVVMDCDRIGAIVLKTVTTNVRKGNAPPRVHETPSGMLNSIGLENKGLDGFIQDVLPRAMEYDTTLIVSVSGENIEDYGVLLRRLDEFKKIDAFELNISCPNVSGGLDYGTDPKLTEEVVKLAKASTDRPILAKLTPNVTDIVPIAEAAMNAGADALSLVNTLKGIAIDWRKRRPILGGVTGGLSGPAIKPVAIRAVWEICSALPDAPVVGIGGLSTLDDVLEIMVAGASAVQIGTALFVDANICEKILDALPGALAAAKVSRIRDLIGTCTPKATRGDSFPGG